MDAAEKTLSVLDALGTTRTGGGSRLGSIAARAELPKSTVHRILKRLVERGYAQAQGDGVYVLGPRILAMAREHDRA
jgi:IclR family acetate operon transcriptional repressor